VSGAGREAGSAPTPIKCVIWDLDGTVWDGTLLEGDAVHARKGIREAIVALDARGVVQSIASRNDPADAARKLQELGLEEYFLFPSIGWDRKSAAVETIAKKLNLGLDTIAVIDDDAYERAEILFRHPEVRCFTPEDVDDLVDRSELAGTSVTEEAASRRHMYVAELQRREAEESWAGPEDEFLSWLEMVLAVSAATEDDLDRIHELTVRTNQLNSTGFVYDQTTLSTLAHSDRHLLWIAEFGDRFGSYGKIGVVLLEEDRDRLTLKLLLTSCRVMHRGVGGLLLELVAEQARARGKRLLAEFVPTGRNRVLYVAFKFAGFSEIERRGEVRVLERDLLNVPRLPAHIDVQVNLPRLSSPRFDTKLIDG
jgi:FkbH-like protein